MFGVPNAKYLVVDTPDSNPLRVNGYDAFNDLLNNIFMYFSKNKINMFHISKKKKKHKHTRITTMNLFV